MSLKGTEHNILRFFPFFFSLLQFLSFFTYDAGGGEWVCVRSVYIFNEAVKLFQKPCLAQRLLLKLQINAAYPNYFRS